MAAFLKHSKYFPNLTLKGRLCSGFCQLHIPFINSVGFSYRLLAWLFYFRGQLGLNLSGKDSFCVKKLQITAVIFSHLCIRWLCISFPVNLITANTPMIWVNLTPPIMYQLILLLFLISVVADWDWRLNKQRQRMAAVETDKELNDLLDFTAVRSLLKDRICIICCNLMSCV